MKRSTLITVLLLAIAGIGSLALGQTKGLFNFVMIPVNDSALFDRDLNDTLNKTRPPVCDQVTPSENTTDNQAEFLNKMGANIVKLNVTRAERIAQQQEQLTVRYADQPELLNIYLAYNQTLLNALENKSAAESEAFQSYLQKLEQLKLEVELAKSSALDAYQAAVCLDPLPEQKVLDSASDTFEKELSDAAELELAGSEDARSDFRTGLNLVRQSFQEISAAAQQTRATNVEQYRSFQEPVSSEQPSE